MRPVFAFLLSFVFVGCASQPLASTKAFDSRPRYSTTVIAVSPSLVLRHRAGRPCDHDSPVRPALGSEGTRTYSTYELMDAGRAGVFTAPSMLSDPKYEGEFENYDRANDRITVLTSKSKNTILIVEDRSPTFPNRAFILLRRGIGSSWAWSQIKVPVFPEAPGPPVDKHYPDVIGLSDASIWLRAEGKTWSQPLRAIKPDA